MYKSLILVIAVTLQQIILVQAIPQIDKRQDNALTSILASLNVAKPTATPSNLQAATSVLSGIVSQNTGSSNLFQNALARVQNGLTSGRNLSNSNNNFVLGNNLVIGTNPPPKSVIYPKASPADAPYDVAESDLRGAIKIPTTFTYGVKPPVILFPGTGGTGYTTYVGNYIKLLSNVPYADPVWVDVPGFLLGDAQTNSEYAAYAINYIASITSTNVSVIAWSQGTLNTQWALKYWPSTRTKVSDFIGISSDFHGTALAYLIAPITEPPAIIQQEYESLYVNTLRRNGGDSAYVPTTSFYSGFFDEIVEPQQDPIASGIIKDARNVGVSNTQLQLACPGQPAGGFVTHEGALANGLGFALAVDALTHPGPGQLSRLNLAEVCQNYLAPGLNLADFALTEDQIVISAVTILTFQPRTLIEPPIKPYALLN